jgi:hypothetical protein
MNLIKLDLNGVTGSEPGNENIASNVGIHELRGEEKVVRTYSNGLSFKHVPNKSRRTYKVAVSAQIRELGLRSAQQCHLHAPKLMDIFARWKLLKERYLKQSEVDEEQNLEELHALTKVLNLPHETMSVEALYRSLDNVFTYRDPKFLAAHLAALCKDRSNLGQSSFLKLVAAGRNYLEITKKLSWLKSLLTEEPKEFVSFLLFGRAPWTETRLSRRFKSVFTWARNFLVGIHNKFTHSLKTNNVSLPAIIVPPEGELVEILEVFIKEIEEKIQIMEQDDKDTSRITSFLNSLKKIRQTPSCLSDWFLIPENIFSWRALKQYASTLHGISFSALRSVFIRVCLHQEVWMHAIERCIRMFTPEATLKKPFHERTLLQPLPIDLVMGKKYVIYRPGNAKKMRDLLLENGCLWFEVPNVRLKDSQVNAKACWYAPKKVLSALEKGVRLRLFRFNMPRGPGKSIKVDVILSGPEELFISTNHLNEVHPNNRDTSTNPKSVLGIDVNRVSEHVLMGSRDLEMNQAINDILSKWNLLESIIIPLQARKDTCRDWKKAHKFKLELRLAHQRRSRLRTDILRRVRIQFGRKVLEWKLSYIGLEADIHKDTKDKRGPLARAITYMPNNVKLIAQELYIINLKFQKDIKIVLVRKEGTSRYHHNCGGIIDRGGDVGTCRICGRIVNTHENAADNIEERAIILIEKYQNNQSSGSTPSAC